MLFMVNVGFGRTNSGIESSEFTRLSLFKKYHYPAKILSVAWYPALHDNLVHFKLTDTDVINLYDYFTGNNQLPNKLHHTRIADLSIPVGLIFDKQKSDKQHYIYSKNGITRMNVVTWSTKTTRVDTANYYGTDGTLTHSETYDSRGYLASRNYFTFENHQLKTFYRVFYSYRGQAKIIMNYGRSALKQADATRIELKDYQGENYEFKTESDFKRFFLDEINTAYGLNNAFIVDRGLVSGWPVINMKTPAFKTMFIHATHLSDFRDPDSQLLNNNYDYAFQVASKWTNMIVSTKLQQQQILNRFGHLNQHIYAIPVGVISDAVFKLPVKPMNKRIPHSVVTLSRLDKQKSVEMQVAAMAIVVKKFADAVLHVYGEGETLTTLKQQAEQLGIKDHIVFHGWVYDKQAALLDKQIFIETSNSEAFGLSMMEAQSYGLPLITTPVESATELIDDGVSGYILSDVIEGHDKLVAEIAQHIIKLFEHPKKLQAMSDAAYQHAKQFSSEKIWQDWQPWVKDATNQKD